MNMITLFLALVFGILVAVAIVVYLLVKYFIASTSKSFDNDNIEETIDLTFEAIGWWINKIIEWWNSWHDR